MLPANTIIASTVATLRTTATPLAMTVVAVLAITFAHPTHAQQIEPYPFTSTEESIRFQSLTKEIRCVVCQNQSIADSNAPLANDLREKIYRMILNKQSNKEIKDYLVKRYGEFILLEPQWNRITAILWMFPLVAVIFIFFILSRQKKLHRKA